MTSESKTEIQIVNRKPSRQKQQQQVEDASNSLIEAMLGSVTSAMYNICTYCIIEALNMLKTSKENQQKAVTMQQQDKKPPMRGRTSRTTVIRHEKGTTVIRTFSQVKTTSSSGQNMARNLSIRVDRSLLQKKSLKMKQQQQRPRFMSYPGAPPAFTTPDMFKQRRRKERRLSFELSLLPVPEETSSQLKEDL